jgi:ABC-type branched-subunit amino acid transport system ATPase component
VRHIHMAAAAVISLQLAGSTFADEPSGGLAPRSVEEIGRIAKVLKSAGTTMLLVEQNIALTLSVVDLILRLARWRYCSLRRVRGTHIRPRGAGARVLSLRNE